MSDGMGFVKIAVVGAIGVVAIMLTPVTCANEDQGKAVAERSGFSDVKTDGYAWFQCGKDDTFATSFVGKNAQGVTVRGAVCCGWLKSCTVRLP